MMTYLTHSWPRAIVHVDGDAFFASVEQAVKPYLKGKPVVTGKERNIVAAASYEARAFGVRRGVALWEARKMCPGLVVLPTDYETVSIFSKRMHEIMRRYSPAVEEYSVDEGFIDLTGTRRVHRADYRTIARRLKEAIERELGIKVTVGLSVSKVLAKAASSLGKPTARATGIEAISAREIEAALRDYPLEKVWMIGANTAALLRNHGAGTAGEFLNWPQVKVESLLTRPGIAVWQELKGESVWPVVTEEKIEYQSISKTKTFTPPTAEREYVWAQVVKNLENACIKARRYKQAAGRLVVFLKREDFRARGAEASLLRPSAYPLELFEVVSELFEQVFEQGTAYRATGVILQGLVAGEARQVTLFEERNRIVKLRRIYGAVDAVKERQGKHGLHHAASLPAQSSQHLASRGDLPARKLALVKGETKRRRLPVPIWQGHTALLERQPPGTPAGSLGRS